MGYLHHALQSSSPLCHPLSCVSSFAWGCVQQRVEEPHSVPGYRVCLPEERSLEQSRAVRGWGGVRSTTRDFGHIKLAILAIPKSSERGGKPSVPHNWVDWVHGMGGALRFRAGHKILTGPQLCTLAA